MEILIKPFIKLAFILLLLSLWSYVEPYANDMKLMGQWLFAKGVYQFLPRSFFLTLSQTVVLISSTRIVLWILDNESEVEDMGESNSFTSKEI